MRRGRRLLTLALLLVASVAILAAARVTAVPAILVSAGAIAGAVVLGLGTRWIWRSGQHSSGGRRFSRATRGMAAMLAALLVGAAALLALIPGPSGSPAAMVSGQRIWDLPAGSQLRYVHIAGRGSRGQQR